MNGGNRMNRRGQDFSSRNRAAPSSPSYKTENCVLPANEQSLIREFIQALAEEIESIKRGGGGSIITVFDGVFVRREGPFFVYLFSTESPLIVMDDAPADVEVGGQRLSSLETPVRFDSHARACRISTARHGDRLARNR
jgi:hypothetical protein